MKMRPFISQPGIIVLGGAILGAFYGLTGSSRASSTPNPSVLRAQKQPMTQQAIIQAAHHTHRGQDTGGVPPVSVPAYPDPHPMNPFDMQPPGGQPYQAVSEWTDGYLNSGADFVAIFGGCLQLYLTTASSRFMCSMGVPVTLFRGRGFGLRHGLQDLSQSPM